MTSKFNQAARTEPEAVRRSMPLPLQKATVVQSPSHPDESGFHQVFVELAQNDSQERALVLAQKDGDVSVPEIGERVIVGYAQGEKPIVLGSYYPVADEQNESNADQIPVYESGERIIGNSSGSYIGIRDDGTIDIVTEGTQPIQIDTQAASVSLGNDQTVPGDNTWVTVDFDTVECDREELFDGPHFTVRHEGQYFIHSMVEVPEAGQNNRYQIGIFIDNELEKVRSYQSSVNAELSLGVSAIRRIEDDTRIDIRVRQDSGSDKILDGSQLTSEFAIERNGV